MSRGFSLEQDLKLLINNPKYSDVEILCEDGEKLYGCRAILAARSEVFDRLLYNGMRESYEEQISFPQINSSGFELILEYLYTGTIMKESLSTTDNIIEVYVAADYFQLSDLQRTITEIVKDTLEKDCENNFLPELLSKAVDKFPTPNENALLNLLIEYLSKIPLYMIEYDRLSFSALQYFLTFTYEKEYSFVTTEYEVLRYSVIMVAKQISIDVAKVIENHLPNLIKLDNIIQNDFMKIDEIFHAHHHRIAEELEPLLKFIDFKRIHGNILREIIKPLKIIPETVLLDAYQYHENSKLCEFRGSLSLFFNTSDLVWDETRCGSNLIIEDHGNLVSARNVNSFVSATHCAGTKVCFKDKGIYEWDIIIEKDGEYSWIGVCNPEGFKYDCWAGNQQSAWILGSNGRCLHDKNGVLYCSSFGDGDVITIHLNMNDRTCSFSVNGNKYPPVSSWNNLPSKLMPIVSLAYPGKLRINPHSISG